MNVPNFTRQFLCVLLFAVTMTTTSKSNFAQSEIPNYCIEENHIGIKVKMSRAKICHPAASPYDVRYFNETTLDKCIEQGGRLPLVLQRACAAYTQEQDTEFIIAPVKEDIRIEQLAEHDAPFGLNFGPGFAITHSRRIEQYYLSSNVIMAVTESHTVLSPLLEAHYMWRIKKNYLGDLFDRHGIFIAGLLEDIELGEEAPVWGIGYMVGMEDVTQRHPLNIGIGMLFESNVPELKPEFDLGMVVEDGTKIEELISSTGNRKSFLIMVSINL